MTQIDANNQSSVHKYRKKIHCPHCGGAVMAPSGHEHFLSAATIMLLGASLLLGLGVVLLNYFFVDSIVARSLGLGF